MARRKIGQERLKLGADQSRQTGSVDVPTWMCLRCCWRMRV
jgi:hypothetical protein